MSHGDKVTELAPGLPHRSPPQTRRALRGRSPTTSGAIMARSSTPKWSHTPDGAKLIANFVRHVCGLRGRLDDGRVPRDQDRGDPRAGRHGPGDLRPVGRRRQRGRGGADPRGDRRAADLRVRRSRADAAGRGRAGRQPVPRPLQYPAGPCGRRDTVPRRARRASPIPRPSASSSARPFIDLFEDEAQQDRRRGFPRPGHALSGRDRERLASPAGPR